MRARRAQRNSHYFGSLGQTEVMIKDQLQDFALSARQFNKRPVKQRANFRVIDRYIRTLPTGRATDALLVSVHSDPAQPLPPPLINCRPADDGKQPGLKRGPSV